MGDIGIEQKTLQRVIKKLCSAVACLQKEIDSSPGGTVPTNGLKNYEGGSIGLGGSLTEPFTFIDGDAGNELEIKIVDNDIIINKDFIEIHAEDSDNDITMEIQLSNLDKNIRVEYEDDDGQITMSLGKGNGVPNGKVGMIVDVAAGNMRFFQPDEAVGRNVLQLNSAYLSLGLSGGADVPNAFPAGTLLFDQAYNAVKVGGGGTTNVILSNADVLSDGGIVETTALTTNPLSIPHNIGNLGGPKKVSVNKGSSGFAGDIWVDWDTSEIRVHFEGGLPAVGSKIVWTASI